MIARINPGLGRLWLEQTIGGSCQTLLRLSLSPDLVRAGSSHTAIFLRET
ncbi:MAG: hypothetical protein RH862_10465 [Leptospiraceae bacterium]